MSMTATMMARDSDVISGDEPRRPWSAVVSDIIGDVYDPAEEFR